MAHVLYGTVRIDGMMSPGAYSFGLMDTGSIALTRDEFELEGRVEEASMKRRLIVVGNRDIWARAHSWICPGSVSAMQHTDPVCYNRYCGYLGSTNNGSLAVVRARLE